MKISMTTKFLDAAKAPAGPRARLDIFDALTPGLNLRVTADKKSWSFVYTPPGTTTRARLSLGTYPATKLEDARARAVEARGKIEGGTDPRTVEAPAAAVTMATLVDDRVRLELRADSAHFKWTCLEIERCYDVDVLPIAIDPKDEGPDSTARAGARTIGALAVKDFRPQHLNRITNRIKDRGANTQANRVYQHVVTLLEFAVQRGEYGVDVNPLASCKPPSKEVIKERVLNFDEIRILWNGCAGALARSDLIPDILRLILALGQRPGEECGAIERHEVDLFKREWLIPAHKAKNKHAHLVPLNDLAVEILARRMRETNGRFLFPNNEGDGPIRNYIISTCVARALEPGDGLPLGRLGVAKFTPHDLRRTFATLASENLKLDSGDPMPELYISHVLNHRSVTKKGVTARIYNHNQYVTEKRECLNKWGAFLAKLVGAETCLRVAA